MLNFLTHHENFWHEFFGKWLNLHHSIIALQYFDIKPIHEKPKSKVVFFAGTCIIEILKEPVKKKYFLGYFQMADSTIF
jgi:hypothetical protein